MKAIKKFIIKKNRFSNRLIFMNKSHHRGRLIKT